MARLSSAKWGLAYGQSLLVEPASRSRCHVRLPSTENCSLSGDQSMRTVWNLLKSSGSEQPPANAVPVPQECAVEWATELMPSPAEHFRSVSAEPDVAGGGRRKFSMMSISPQAGQATSPMSWPSVHHAGQVPSTPGTLSRASQRPYAISTLPCVLRRPEVIRPSLSLRALVVPASVAVGLDVPRAAIERLEPRTVKVVTEEIRWRRHYQWRRHRHWCRRAAAVLVIGPAAHQLVVRVPCCRTNTNRTCTGASIGAHHKSRCAAAVALTGQRSQCIITGNDVISGVGTHCVQLVGNGGGLRGRSELRRRITATTGALTGPAAHQLVVRVPCCRTTNRICIGPAFIATHREHLAGNGGGLRGLDTDDLGLRGIDSDGGGLRGLDMDVGGLRGIDNDGGGLRSLDMDVGGLRGIDNDGGGLRGIDMDVHGLRGLEHHWSRRITATGRQWRQCRHCRHCRRIPAATVVIIGPVIGNDVITGIDVMTAGIDYCERLVGNAVFTGN
eukprot:scaffold73279_cov61-Phaeocystis_antarctica.AAC.2